MRNEVLVAGERCMRALGGDFAYVKRIVLAVSISRRMGCISKNQA